MKTEKAKKVIRYGKILLILVVVGYIARIAYIKSPSEVWLQVAEGPNEVLAEFVAIAEKGVPINPDPYAASTYQPDDVLYDAVHRAQNGFTREAMELLDPLVN